MRWVFAAITGVVLTIAIAAWMGQPVSLQTPAIEAEGKFKGLDITRIREDVQRLSSHPTRVTGYPGCEAAFDFILKELRAAGISEIEIQEFKVPVPIVHEAYLTGQTPGGEVRIPLHPLWPNLARTSMTPPDGIGGPLIDVGTATEMNLSGKRLKDALVVVDWHSNIEWLSVPEFGGRAVIFRANELGTGNLARSKFLSVPADIPRYYVAEEDVPALNTLLQHPQASGTVFCRMNWEQKKGRNIFAKITEGSAATTARDQAERAPVILNAFYDSISVVPTISPGAEQAVSPAVLLELVRFFQERETTRPLYVLFTSGHGQAMAGVTHFVSVLREGLLHGWPGDKEDSLLAQMGRPGLFTSLALSSRSDQFGVFCQGQFRGYYEHLLRPKFSTLGLKLDEYAKAFRTETDPEKHRPAFVDCINLTLGRGWWTYFPYRAVFESEMPCIAGIPGVSLATLNDDHRYVDTPDDTFDRLDFDLLKRQIVAQPGYTSGLSRIALALCSWTGRFVSNEIEDKWARLSGRVVWLDQERNYTPNEPLVNATVFLKTQKDDKYLMGTRGIPTVMTNEQGEFEFDGLIQVTANWSFSNCLLEAYGTADDYFLGSNENAAQEFLDVLSRGGMGMDRIVEDGSVVYAVDMARPKEYPWQAEILKEQQSVNLVCFPSRSFTLLGLTDPRGYIALRDMQILEVGTKSPPFQYGKSVTDSPWGNPAENCVTLWADPTIQVLINLGLGTQEKRLILINNSEENPEGDGFQISDLRTIPSMVLQGANDIWRLNDTRITKLSANGISNPRVEETHEESRVHLKRAGEALANYDYLTYRVESEKGWALESKAYNEVLSMINNMIRGVLFYLALLIPFAYCLERLLFASGSITKRIQWMVLIFVASFVLLAMVHPAFKFTLTPTLVLLAFTILALSGTVSLLIVSKVDLLLKERKQASVGIHEDTQNVGNIAMRAVDLGIANIRRRPQRGFLTGLTIVLVTFILLSFTSLVPVVSISKLPHPEGVPAYRGLLARERSWAPLPGPLYDSLLRNFSEEFQENISGESFVAPRGWFFSDYSGELSQIDLTPVIDESETAGAEREGREIFTAVALLCLSPEETRVTGVGKTLVAGRWFKDENEASIILPLHVAKMIGLGPEDIGRRIRVFGQELPLVGIVDEKKFDAIEDIDGEPLTPVNFVLQRQIKAKEGDIEQQTDTLEEYVHYPTDQIAILPFKFGHHLGAAIRSIAIKTAPEIDPGQQAEGYAKRSNLTILASKDDRVTLYASLDSSQLKAAGQILVPLVLGFIMVLGTMLGSVYERQREIFVYNSVGLSPTNVSSLFLAESTVYAVIGAGLGYLLGQATSRILLVTGALSGLTLNYSAGTAVFVTVLTMVIVLLSTVYPARKAFYAAIPESHEKPDEDEGGQQTDQLSLFLPFVATPGNILGMQAYMYEYLDSIQGVTVGQLGVDHLAAACGEHAGRTCPVLTFRAWLAPFDLGISHDVELAIVYREDHGVYQYHLKARRFSGDQQNWRRLTPRFVQTIRKQLLMWRIVKAEAQQNYNSKGKALFGDIEV